MPPNPAKDPTEESQLIPEAVIPAGTQRQIKRHYRLSARKIHFGGMLDPCAAGKND
jgi:hypothetical protein